MQSITVSERPLPFDSLTLPIVLDGSEGINRRYGEVCQIDAQNDWQAIQCWLMEFDDSPQTYRNYRKEVERLLLWSTRSRNKPLSSLVREDFHAYQTFLNDPVMCFLLIHAAIGNLYKPPQ